MGNAKFLHALSSAGLDPAAAGSLRLSRRRRCRRLFISELIKCVSATSVAISVNSAGSER